MRAFQVQDFKGTFGLTEVPQPQPGPGEVALAIRACGVNFADLLLTEGRYQEKPPLPFTLGMEVAGVVEALGPGVTGLAPGDRVGVFGRDGGLAEAGVFPADRCVKLPDSMGFDTAAAFLVGYGTAHVALGHRARLQPGETLFVTGAAGGAGLTAVELGAAMGARVIASARGGEKLARAKSSGAAHVIDSEAPDLRAALRDLGGVDVVYDTVGGPAFHEALRATRPEGRLIPVGFAGGEVPQIPANLLLVKNLTVLGVYWGGYMSFSPQVIKESFTELFALFEAGRITPHISHHLPLERVEEALDLVRNRKSTGKVVVTIG
ncbi:NADPH:quinone oxidoreductase family protein [Falsigemmobacter faecalis]|uniref:NADPH:quinone oxidoreductase family protein n=1 Tax=Falsigemmobacter faecalis TaxID=2488730 RepID=A0A3P3DIB4_9RHOB|nr:NADPH:quinone oxidoreductase family protein [Falsigemmobacter faecalis]RRH73456.1 NADPH:quinone oxidoreductase family protein [Falsigemmobacter faecalis]